MWYLDSPKLAANTPKYVKLLYYTYMYVSDLFSRMPYNALNAVCYNYIIFVWFVLRTGRALRLCLIALLLVDRNGRATEWCCKTTFWWCFRLTRKPLKLWVIKSSPSVKCIVSLYTSVYCLATSLLNTFTAAVSVCQCPNNCVACVLTVDGGNSESRATQRSARCVAKPKGRRILLWTDDCRWKWRSQN